ncbi:MAG: Bacterial rane flanked domain protein [Candidatus Saccharibacteria bacterium]|nr:Bacterial rane flanked domain protein [Candidatus Saccharibacteria bacterium]
MAQAKDEYIEPVHESTFALGMRIVFVQLSLGLANLVANAILVANIDAIADNSLLLLALGITTIIIQAADAIIIAGLVIKWAHTRYIFRRGEAIIETGIFHIRQRVYKVEDIKSLEVEQSFLGKLLDYGTISFYSMFFQQGVKLPYIPNPHRYVQLLEGQV